MLTRKDTQRGSAVVGSLAIVGLIVGVLVSIAALNKPKEGLRSRAQTNTATFADFVGNGWKIAQRKLVEYNDASGHYYLYSSQFCRTQSTPVYDCHFDVAVSSPRDGVNFIQEGGHIQQNPIGKSGSGRECLAFDAKFRVKDGVNFSGRPELYFAVGNGAPPGCPSGGTNVITGTPLTVPTTPPVATATPPPVPTGTLFCPAPEPVVNDGEDLSDCRNQNSGRNPRNVQVDMTNYNSGSVRVTWEQPLSDANLLRAFRIAIYYDKPNGNLERQVIRGWPDIKQVDKNTTSMLVTFDRSRLPADATGIAASVRAIYRDSIAGFPRPGIGNDLCFCRTEPRTYSNTYPKATPTTIPTSPPSSTSVPTAVPQGSIDQIDLEIDGSGVFWLKKNRGACTTAGQDTGTCPTSLGFICSHNSADGSITIAKGPNWQQNRPIRVTKFKNCPCNNIGQCRGDLGGSYSRMYDETFGDDESSIVCRIDNDGCEKIPIGGTIPTAGTQPTTRPTVAPTTPVAQCNSGNCLNDCICQGNSPSTCNLRCAQCADTQGQYCAENACSLSGDTQGVGSCPAQAPNCCLQKGAVTGTVTTSGAAPVGAYNYVNTCIVQADGRFDCQIYDRRVATRIELSPQQYNHPAPAGRTGVRIYPSYWSILGGTYIGHAKASVIEPILCPESGPTSYECVVRVPPGNSVRQDFRITIPPCNEVSCRAIDSSFQTSVFEQVNPSTNEKYYFVQSSCLSRDVVTMKRAACSAVNIAPNLAPLTLAIADFDRSGQIDTLDVSTCIEKYGKQVDTEGGLRVCDARFFSFLLSHYGEIVPGQ